MKKIFVLSLSLFAALSGMKAQSAKDVFSATEIVWYGLDFTKTKFVGQFDQGMGAMPATGSDMKNKYVGQWNALVAKEPQNFKLKETFRKDNVYYDMASVNELNSKIDPDNCMSYNAGKIDKTEIDGMVKKYTGEKKSGTGLSFIIENFDKGMQTADIYVTFFDIASKKVLICEKLSVKATAGVGLKNYWASAIKAALKQIDANEYKNWKSKY